MRAVYIVTIKELQLLTIDVVTASIAVATSVCNAHVSAVEFVPLISARASSTYHPELGECRPSWALDTLTVEKLVILIVDETASSMVESCWRGVGLYAIVIVVLVSAAAATWSE